MREIEVRLIADEVARLSMEANWNLPGDVEEALRAACASEESPLGREVLESLLENARIARDEKIPICQDCGFTVIFLDVGQDIHFVGGSLEDALNEGVRRGYTDGYLRKSIVDDPVYRRKNSGDNTPPVVHTRIVPGDRVRIVLAPKGGGSENMSVLGMLKPAQGEKGVRELVVKAVEQAGSNPCPPVVVGVGIGGTSEMAMVNSKRALLRTLGEKSVNPDMAKLEEALLKEVNALGVGPEGFGGRTTALAVHIESYPCHLASMPVAVNLQCHAARHKEAEI